MNIIQSYFDLYELFTQIKNRYNLHSHLDWIGQNIDNYKFLNLFQQYISTEQWRKVTKIIISQYSSEINSFLKGRGLKVSFPYFDPHNQISGFSQISTSLGWINPKNQNGLIELSESFRIVETMIGKDTIHLICCAVNVKDVAICFIPITPEIKTFISYYNFDLDKLGYFDLLQIIQILKTYIRRQQSTKPSKSIKSLHIKPIELSSSNDCCLNQLKTHFSGSPFEIVNVQQINTLQLTNEGLLINQNNTPIKDNKENKEKEIKDNKENKEEQYVIENNYILWVEDVSLINNIVLACYVNI